MPQNKWEKEFDEMFYDIDVRGAAVINSDTDTIKQFITDLRKKDMEELIKEFNQYTDESNTISRKDFKQLIKDYYEE